MWLCFLSQERYDEKWNLFVVPKVIEEELNCKVDEDNMRRKLAEAAQREAGQALEAEGNRLQQVDHTHHITQDLLLYSY